jgi:hypothetical protein
MRIGLKLNHMKHFTCLFFAVVFLSYSACKKSATTTFTGIYGQWKINADFYSPGTAPAWHNVTAGDKRYIIFDQSGKLETNAYTGYSKFTVKDSVTLLFSGTSPEENYRYTLRHDTLVLGPAGPIYCIEGCATRFVR